MVTFFPGRLSVEIVGLLLIVLPTVYFIPLYTWKAKADPDFCRSETHIQRLKKIELEMMGSEMHQIKGEVLELTAKLESEPLALKDNGSKGGDE